MAYNANWPKWVQASVAKHFKTTANSNGFASLVEELEERTTDFQENPQRIEIRVNGPILTEFSKGFWLFEVSINMLIFSHMDGNIDNVYRGVEMAGIMAQRAAEPIPIHKYGSGNDDDSSFIGCLRVVTGPNDNIKVSHFGELRNAARMRQLSVDASYDMTLCP